MGRGGGVVSYRLLKLPEPLLEKDPAVGGAAASSDSETSESDDDWIVDGKGDAKARESKPSEKTARNNRSSGSEAENRSASRRAGLSPRRAKSRTLAAVPRLPAGCSGSEDDDDDDAEEEEFNDGYDEKLKGARGQ
nr:RNA polymerase-associated protein RTF1 homolog [Dermacentor andersoni]